MPSMIMFHAVGPEKASPANRFLFPFDLLVTSRPKVVSAGTGDGPMVRCDSPPCNRLLSWPTERWCGSHGFSTWAVAEQYSFSTQVKCGRLFPASRRKESGRFLWQICHNVVACLIVWLMLLLLLFLLLLAAVVVAAVVVVCVDCCS